MHNSEANRKVAVHCCNVLSKGKEQQMNLKEQILDLSRQARIAPLSPVLDTLFNEAIERGVFLQPEKLAEVRDSIVADLKAYREQTGRETVVLGMSGGVDSALTAALFKEAGWRVVGFTLPIDQNPEETDRGEEACHALDIEHRHLDLSTLYHQTLIQLGSEGGADVLLSNGDDSHEVRIRKGNIRARLRMITLYNMASALNGVVASTDNYSELSAGFWTLHGDVGDLSPIQSLYKSWEVPYLSSISGVPESTWRATPTDGLGISAGDEAQLGASYLEWDIMLNAMMHMSFEAIEELIEKNADVRAAEVFEAVKGRMGRSWFKRMNPVNIDHSIHRGRYLDLEVLDEEFQPDVVK